MVHSQAEYIEQNSNTKRKQFRRVAFWFKQDAVLRNRFRFAFFELSEKSGFWKTAIIHFVRGIMHFVKLITKGGGGVKNLGKSDYVICELKL